MIISILSNHLYKKIELNTSFWWKLLTKGQITEGKLNMMNTVNKTIYPSNKKQNP